MATAATGFGSINYSRIAREAGISVSHAHRILNGRREPRLGIGVRLAEALCISVPDLYRRIQKAKAAASR